MPGATPNAIASGLAKVMTPRCPQSPPCPIRAERWPIAAAATPSLFEIVQPADSGLLAAHARVAQDHGLDAGFRRQIGRIDAAMRGRDRGAAARVGRENGHAIEDERGGHVGRLLFRAPC